MRILIDTNVILDIVQKREPFFADSYQALRKAIEADAECLISRIRRHGYFLYAPQGVPIRAKSKGRDRTAFPDRHLCGRTGVDIHTALMRSMPDFEDAVVDAVAERNGASYILTRNIKDFAVPPFRRSRRLNF